MSKQPNQPSTPITSTEQTKSNSLTVNIISVLLAVVISLLLVKISFQPPKIAYVDTAKIMVGFNEAARVQRFLQEEDDKWKKQLKELQDSLASHVDVMTKEVLDPENLTGQSGFI